MPSPFPGMDPYLESPAIWSDFHATFTGTLRVDLNRILPRGYVARLDRYVWIDEPELSSSALLGKPDAYVADTLDRIEEEGAVTTLAAPVTGMLPVVERKGKPFIKVVDLERHRVITVIELLSPANKTAGKDREAYLAKRNEYFVAQVNLVEIDLLRAGLRAPVNAALPPADYYIIVSRALDFPRAGIWPITLRDPLPVIPIPLAPQDEMVWLALQPAFTRAFEDARYDEEINYHSPPDPPLRESEAFWARELLAGRQS